MRVPRLKKIPAVECIAVLLILLQTACKKNPGTANSLSSSFKASFIIYEPFYGTSAIYPTDTIVMYQAIFAATENYDTYSWTIGTDPTIHTTKSFKLNFPLSVSGSTLSAKLIASKNGKTDTVIKSFAIFGVKGTPNENVTPYCIRLPYLGKFEGNYEDAPSHKFVVTITNLDTSSVIGGFKEFRILNLPEGCGGKYVPGQTCVGSEVSAANYSYPFDFTYKAFYVDNGDDLGCCPRVNLYGSLDKENSNKIRIDCVFLNSDPNKVIKRTFIGYRL